MDTFVLSEINSIANNFLAEIRDKDKQKDSMRFRRNLERLGEVLAYEISKSLTYRNELVETPLGTSSMNLLKLSPVLITIMRAGFPFYQGFLQFFDRSDSGFIGAFRHHPNGGNHFDIHMQYAAFGDLDKREVIIIDPMIASGKSLLQAVETILKIGNPSRIHVAGLIASRKGVELLKKECKKVKTLFWFCAIDEELNDKSYIVPGLGDAGDLSFGKKL